MCNGGVTARRLERRGPFEVDSFHATSIGIMLNVENVARTGKDPPPLQCRRPLVSVKVGDGGGVRKRKSEGAVEGERKKQ